MPTVRTLGFLLVSSSGGFAASGSSPGGAMKPGNDFGPAGVRLSTPSAPNRDEVHCVAE
jgi:hypothetical protein